jgi:hypothetical protein
VAQYGSNYNYGDSPYYKDEGWDGVADLFYFFPNWKYDVSVEYAFKTIITDTRYRHEQRKALFNLPIRKQRFTVTKFENGLELWNYLMAIRAEDLYVPIFSEPVRCTGGALTGLIGIPTTNNLARYNLRHMTNFVLMVDLREIETAEVHFISEVQENAIVFGDPVEGAFIGRNTLIYPLFKCYLSDKSRKDITDKVMNITVEFTEYEVYA